MGKILKSTPPGGFLAKVENSRITLKEAGGKFLGKSGTFLERDL